MSRFKPPQKAKRDDVEPLIVAALRAHGFMVYRLDLPVDLAFAKHGRTWLAEVKTGNKKLRPEQAKFIEEWPAEVPVFRTVEDVQEFVRRI